MSSDGVSGSESRGEEQWRMFPHAAKSSMHHSNLILLTFYAQNYFGRIVPLRKVAYCIAKGCEKHRMSLPRAVCTIVLDGRHLAAHFLMLFEVKDRVGQLFSGLS